MIYRQRKCLPTQYRCVTACPHNAIQIQQNHSPPLRFDRSSCDRCESLACVTACLTEALQIVGRTLTVDELMRILVRDQGFWGGEGGVTFSGGEPLLQADFLLAVLAQCRAHYMHTAVETSAHANPELLMEVLKWTDWLFIDLKHMDSLAHKAGTGVGNERILKNVEVVATADWHGRLIIRVPIVPGFNDALQNLQATAAFMVGLGLQEVNLLPFHRLGNSKYEQLGLAYKYAGVPSPSGAAMRAHQRIFEAAGLHCYVGSETPF